MSTTYTLKGTRNRHLLIGITGAIMEHCRYFSCVMGLGLPSYRVGLPPDSKGDEDDSDGGEDDSDYEEDDDSNG